MTERRVRIDPSFFEDVDRYFRSERGPEGQPSRGDFQSYDLLEIRDRFASDFDKLPEIIDGRPEYRELILYGRLAVIYAALAQLATDGAVEIIRLRVDFTGLPDDD